MAIKYIALLFLNSLYLKNNTPLIYRLLIFLCFFTTGFVCKAQVLKKFSGQSFSVNEGLLANRVKDLVEDENGFMWISTAIGLQRFDGIIFKTITKHQGLPETNNLRFFKLKNGKIWVSYHTGISAYNSITNKFTIIYKTPDKILKQTAETFYTTPLLPLLESYDLVWCWVASKNLFLAIDKNNYVVKDTFSLPAGLDGLRQFRTGNNGTLLFNSNSSIAKIDFTGKKFLQTYNFPEFKEIYNFSVVNNNKLLLLTSKGIFKADIFRGVAEKLSGYPANVNMVNINSASLDYLYDKLFIAGIGSELYVINGENGEFKYRMVNQKNEPFVSPGFINFCLQDKYSHLWVVSNVEGLKKINFNKLAIKYYGVKDVKKNFNRCIYPDKINNIIITGSLFNGVCVFDTSGNLIKEYAVPPYTANAEVSCILKIGNYKYLIFLDSKNSVYQLDVRQWKFTPVSQNNSRRYFPLKTDTNSTMLLHKQGLTKIRYANNKIHFDELLTNKDFLCGLLDKKSQLWTGSVGSYQISNGKNFSNQTIFNLKEKVTTKCIYQDAKGYIWLGTEAGLYKINAESKTIVHLYKKADGLTDETIYSIIGDDKNNIWCSTNKGISCLYTNGKIINVYASDGLQDNEFNTNAVAKTSDGELFFGGINGVNSFYPGKIKTLIEEPDLLMTNIKVLDKDWNADSAVWNINEIKLPYTQNILSFGFTAIGWYSPAVYNYQYRMKGIDKDWVNAGNLGYARYALPPGTYTFEYAANNNFEKNFKGIKYISIIITPPYFHTWWFTILIILFACLILFAGVKYYHKIQNQKTLRQMEIQKTVQTERERISRDLHDNIGAYASVLMASAEQLNSKITEPDAQQSLENVSENAKNIMGSLQQTIWVLNNEAITLTDFYDRFKLYAKKVLQNFDGVQITYNEQLNNDLILSPEEALNIFRIMQEALQNALKHGKPQHIIVSVNSDKTIYISLKDDGKGFNIHDANTGNGLFNMKHRAKEAGYTLSIISGDKGTEVGMQKI